MRALCIFTFGFVLGCLAVDKRANWYPQFEKTYNWFIDPSNDPPSDIGPIRFGMAKTVNVGSHIKTEAHKESIHLNVTDCDDIKNKYELDNEEDDTASEDDKSLFDDEDDYDNSYFIEFYVDPCAHILERLTYAIYPPISWREIEPDLNKCREEHPWSKDRNFDFY
jgi:hypothetical protein